MLTIKDARIQSNSYHARVQQVDTLLIHYTAVNFETAMRKLLFDSVSVHYVLDLDGTAYKLIENNEVGYHAGISYWNGKHEVNANSIGIEIINLDGNVHAYPQVQINALAELCQHILQENPSITPQNIVGHSDVAPKRKIDPGVLFPWKFLADSGIGLWPSAATPESVGSEAEIMALLERIGYSPVYCYGVSQQGGFMRVPDPHNPPANCSQVVEVGSSDILRAFQMHYEANAANGVATDQTMGLLRRLNTLIQKP